MVISESSLALIGHCQTMSYKVNIANLYLKYFMNHMAFLYIGSIMLFSNNMIIFCLFKKAGITLCSPISSKIHVLGCKISLNLVMCIMLN